MTSYTDHEEPWERAKRRARENLTESEWLLFENATVENLFYEASSTEKLHRDNSRSRLVAEKLQPLIDAVSQYGNALDILSNTPVASIVFVPLWGSIRVVLHVASQFDKYFQKLVDMFERIGDVLPRLQRYEALFPGDKHLRESLSAVYLDIIDFCMKARSLFWDMQKGKRKNGLISLKLTWKSFERTFGDVLSKFRRHRKNIEQDVMLSHMIAASAEMCAQGKEREAQELERRVGEKKENLLALSEGFQAKCRRLLSRLCHYDHGKMHVHLSRRRQQGTGLWLRKSDEFLHWLKNDQSCCFWVWGIPGSGKTLLATGVVDFLKFEQSSNSRNSSLAYYYCDYKTPNTLTPSEILGSYVAQLLHGIQNITTDIEKTLTELLEDGRFPTLQQTFEFLCKIIKSQRRSVFLVLDGLDEIPEAERDDLLRYIKDLARFQPSIVKIFVLSRREVDITAALRTAPTVASSAANMSGDIRVFVEDKIQHYIRSGRLVLSGAGIRDEIISTLVKKAGPLFLWVTFQLEEICEATSDSDLRECLESLPTGLTETYQRALRRTLSRGSIQRARARRLFQWLAVAKRTMYLDELCEVVAIQPNDKQFPSTGFNGSQIVRACANLVVHDDVDGTVTLAHQTVRDFLLAIPNSGDVGLHDFHFNGSEANITAGEICVTYLCFDAFDMQLGKRRADMSPAQRLVLERPAETFISHSLGLKNSYRNIWDFILCCRNGKRPVHSPFNPTNLLYIRRTSPDLSAKFKLLNYAIDHWLDHTGQFSKSNTSTWELFTGLCFEKQRSFSITPWRDSNELFAFALKKGHIPLLSIVSFYYCGELNIQTIEKQLGTSIFAYAYEARYTTALLVLLDHGFDDSTGGSGTALDAAFKHGYVPEIMRCEISPNIDHHPVIKAIEDHLSTPWLLLPPGMGISEHRFNSVHTPLHLATRMASADLVSDLLAKGVNYNARDFLGRTALHLACSFDWEQGVPHTREPGIVMLDIVDLLLAAGADFSIRANDNMLPFHCAILRYRSPGDHQANMAVKIMGRLLTAGADVNIDFPGGFPTVYLLCSEEFPDHSWLPCPIFVYRDSIPEVVKWLFGAKMNVNARAKNGMTALHLLAQALSNPFDREQFNITMNIARELLESGADCNIQTLYGATPLHLLFGKGAPPKAAVSMFLQYGADVRLRTFKFNNGISNLRKNVLEVAEARWSLVGGKNEEKSTEFEAVIDLLKEALKDNEKMLDLSKEVRLDLFAEARKDRSWVPVGLDRLMRGQR